jgi:hypothetical protein
MTVDRLPESAGEERERTGLPPATILSMCDRVLGEVGRRSHMFSWLRAPGSSAERWLAVDAYYPRARLVVMCRPAPGPHDDLYRELIPAHRLGLLTLDSVALGDDPAAVEVALARRILDLEHVPRRPASATPHEPNRSGRKLSRAPVASHAPPREAKAPPSEAAEWTRVTVARTPIPPAVVHALGVLAGLVLTAVLVAEIYLAVVAVGLQAGRPLLGLAIALEACSRGLGTVAAERAGERGWALGCAVGGAPVVACFALAGSRQGRADVEPAPLAGLLALVAGVIALLALLTGI